MFVTYFISDRFSVQIALQKKTFRRKGERQTISGYPKNEGILDLEMIARDFTINKLCRVTL